ncbi:VanZ family protein [Actinomadura rayongensis]|uniref:VanZ family protein n=1 Tax=Actinomadura rayongensis TaxID=1429076 RepID=A0A6I4WBK7_9ACTN|nr:VanZ family protein [Actinomadura rayongensis]
MSGTIELQQPAKPREPVRWYVRALRVVAVLIALAGLAAFSYAAYRLTLTPVADHGQAGGNTDPGHSLRFYWDRPFKDAALQIGGNLLLLAPLGVLAPVASVRLRGPLRLVFLGALVSFVIECTQGLAVTGRAFDVDDIILNTAGVLLAYLVLGRRLSRTLRGRR